MGKGGDGMAEAKKFDWISLLVGFVLVIGGVFSLSHPLSTFLTLAIMLGIVVLVRGIMLIVAFFKLEDKGVFCLDTRDIVGYYRNHIPF